MSFWVGIKKINKIKFFEIMKNIIIYFEYLGYDKNKNVVDVLFVWILVNK